jgi:hypothetical protein
VASFAQCLEGSGLAGAGHSGDQDFRHALRLRGGQAVFPPLPLGPLPGPPGLLRPDPLFGRGSPRVAAVHVQAALQLRQPQPEPPDHLPVSVPLRPQPGDLRVLRLYHRPQPRVRSTKPGGIIRHGLIGHAPQAPTPTATRQIDERRNNPATSSGSHRRHQAETQ